MGRNWRVMHGWHWCVAFLWTALPGCAATYHVSPGAPAIVMRGDATLAWRDTAGERCIPDVPVALAHLPQQGTALGFHLAGAEGVGGYRRHWQGIQRLSTGDTTYFFISRSGSQTAVLIASFGSRPPGGGVLGTSWVPAEGGGNGAPPEADRVVARIPFDSGYTHAGGLSLVGTVLAVPMDGEGHSQVAFYDVSTPKRPRRLGAFDHGDVPAPSTSIQASAVGLGRLADGRYLMILGVHSSKILEFFVSDSGSLESPGLAFHRLGIRVGQGVGGFQNLAVLTQCDGALYMVGTHNTAVPPPSRGHDHVHWYRLEIDDRQRILVRKTGERLLRCTYCNLAAGAGLYIGPSGEVYVYATGFWTRTPGAWVPMEEFAPTGRP